LTKTIQDLQKCYSRKSNEEREIYKLPDPQNANKDWRKDGHILTSPVAGGER
jgi:hypothetical protein